MEAQKLATLADLLAYPDERVELIDGEIVRRPMARAEHGLVQSNRCRRVAVLAAPHQPRRLVDRHRDQRPLRGPSVPEPRPRRLAPRAPARAPQRDRRACAADWVCEIVSPGHERKDTLTLLLLLQRHRVPYYWLIWPEERTLVAYGLDGGSYRIVADLTVTGADAGRVAIPPFEAVPIDLGYILGG
jgi:Uma2 family endonuclease